MLLLTAADVTYLILILNVNRDYYSPLTAPPTTRWQFTAFTIALGSSYFQRLLEDIPQLQAAVRLNPRFSDYAAHIGLRGRGHRGGAAPLPPTAVAGGSGKGAGGPQSAAAACSSTESTLQAIQFTCVYLAAKVVDRLCHPRLLQTMLSQLYGTAVNRQQVCEVEGKCLDGLKWRLGPFYAGDHGQAAPGSAAAEADEAADMIWSAGESSGGGSPQ